jgi:F0F1-type ATP synthase assembly protein I
MLPSFPNGKDLGRYVAVGQVSLEMVVPIAIGLAADYFIDWGHWGVVIGTILGFTGGLFHLIHLANKLDKKDADSPAQGPKSEAP